MIGGVYPAIVQQFQVKPNEADKEAPYIARNIERPARRTASARSKRSDYQRDRPTRPAGRAADDADTSQASACSTPPWCRRRSSSCSRSGLLRVPGRRSTSTATRRRQRRAGRRRRGARARPERPAGGSATGSTSTGLHPRLRLRRGLRQPARRATASRSFTRAEHPADRAPLGDQPEPRDLLRRAARPTYSIVGAPARRDAVELDYPRRQARPGSATRPTTGNGRRAGRLVLRASSLYALKFQEKNLLLSERVNPKSQILYDRNPRERVQKVAPWLTRRRRPVPGGRRRPDRVDRRRLHDLRRLPVLRAQRRSATPPTDSLTATPRPVAAQPATSVNYIRNSVKATVDAYDGKVTLYAWDDEDPVLKTWMKAFPGTVQAAARRSRAT